MIDSGFAKIFRKIQDHWVYENAVWLKAWITIIQDAQWRDDEDLGRGELVLTEVYRKLQADFTKDQWRYFVKQLVLEDMIEVTSCESLGRGKGYRQVAMVKKYDEYHSKNEDAVKDAVTTLQTPLLTRSKQPSQTEETSTVDAVKTQQVHEKDAVKNAVVKEKTLQEVKEKDTSSENHEDASELVKIDESPPTVELAKAHPFGEVYQAWNDNCGDLPKSRGNKAADKLIKALLMEVPPDDLALRIAKGACVVRHESWWQQNRYGLVNLLRNLDSKVEIYDSGQGFTGRSASFESEFERIMGALT